MLLADRRFPPHGACPRLPRGELGVDAHGRPALVHPDLDALGFGRARESQAIELNLGLSEACGLAIPHDHFVDAVVLLPVDGIGVPLIRAHALPSVNTRPRYSSINPRKAPMPDVIPESEFHGVFMPIQSQLRLTGITVDADGKMAVNGYEVRWDMWPQWLQIAQTERDLAVAARANNPGRDDSTAFAASLVDELKHGMVSLCAAAFTLEAFTTSVLHLKPDAAVPPDLKMSAAARIHQTWVHAFRMSNGRSKNSRVVLKALFNYRNLAVHPRAAFSVPRLHDTYHVALEARFLNYSSENAATTTKSAHDLIEQLVSRPRGTDEEWLAWCKAQLDHFTPPPELPEVTTATDEQTTEPVS